MEKTGKRGVKKWITKRGSQCELTGGIMKTGFKRDGGETGKGGGEAGTGEHSIK